MKKIPTDIPEPTTKELASLYFHALQEAVDFVQTEIVPVLHGQLQLSEKEDAILGTFYRIHAIASSLTRLNNTLDFNAVVVLSRTMFELLLDLKTLTDIEMLPKRLHQFREFAKIDRFNKAEKIVKFEHDNQGIESYSKLESKIRKKFIESSKNKSDIEAQVESLWGKDNKGNLKWPKQHWSGLSTRERARSFGSLYEYRYLELYTFMSSFVHSGNAAYAMLSQETLEGVYGLFQNFSREMYIESLILCSKTFSLDKIIEGFSEMLIFLKDAPRNIYEQTQQTT